MAASSFFDTLDTLLHGQHVTESHITLLVIIISISHFEDEVLLLSHFITSTLPGHPPTLLIRLRLII